MTISEALLQNYTFFDLQKAHKHFSI